MNNEWDIVKIQKVTFFMAHPLYLFLQLNNYNDYFHRVKFLFFSVFLKSSFQRKIFQKTWNLLISWGEMFHYSKKFLLVWVWLLSDRVEGKDFHSMHHEKFHLIIEFWEYWHKTSAWSKIDRCGNEKRSDTRQKNNVNWRMQQKYQRSISWLFVRQFYFS